MKKKVLAMIMTVAMAVGMLAGCGGKTEEPAADAAATESTTRDRTQKQRQLHLAI